MKFSTKILLAGAVFLAFTFSLLFVDLRNYTIFDPAAVFSVFALLSIAILVLGAYVRTKENKRDGEAQKEGSDFDSPETEEPFPQSTEPEVLS